MNAVTKIAEHARAIEQLAATLEPDHRPIVAQPGDVQLTANFTLAEMVRSGEAQRRGIDNTPAPLAIEALRTLCDKVLQPVRAHFGRPIVVTSGYRSPELNAAIGGSRSSQHCRGEAADFTIPGHSNLEVCKWLEANLQYDQLIYEFGEAGWVHVSYRVGRLHNQELRAVRQNGRTQYLPGLEP